MYSEESFARQCVAVKRTALNHDCGLVRIIFEIDDNNTFVLPNERDSLQDRLVWISSGYSTVDDQFREGQAMLLEKVTPQDKKSETYLATPEKTRADYWATGKFIKPIPDSQIIPIIHATLPDQASGLFRTEETIPPGPMFIRNKDSIYGPFHAVRDEDGMYRAEPHQQMILQLNNDHVAKFHIADVLETGVMLNTPQTEERCYSSYITDLRSLAKSRLAFEKIDYISDAQLVQYFVKNAFGRGKSPIARKQADSLKIAIAEQAKKTKLLDDPRIKRLSNILEKYLVEKDPGEQIIHDWLSTHEGKIFAADFLKDKPALSGESPAFKEQQQEIEEIKQQAADYREKRDQEKRAYEQARTKLQNELEQERIRSEQELHKSLNEDKKNLLQQLGTDVQELNEKKSQIETEIEELQTEKKLRIEAKKLHAEIEYLEKYKDGLRDKVQELDNILKNPSLGQEVSRLHWHLELLNGHLGSNTQKEATYTPSPQMSAQPNDPKMLISAIATRFDDEGRPFTFEEMANLLITIQQSLMTVLKGRPGSGKTSSAIRLAQALNITSTAYQSDDFLNVPVSRGWVSGRDFLGYFNPLKGSYQPARTGVYQFLCNGTQKDSSSTVRIILLDEANLSPIEHYLSDFIGMFDPEGRKRPIDTGAIDEKKYVDVPENIRFIATINSDGTTEPLSPRMCDRVPVISMDYEEPDGNDLLSDLTLDGAVSYGVLEKFFGTTAAGDTSFADVTIKLRKFTNKMSTTDPALGRAIPVSARKQIAIASYFKVAKDFIGETRAADFAISQHLLPLINGSGKKFGGRLKELTILATDSGFERTKHLLQEIIESGEENIDNYSFF